MERTVFLNGQFLPISQASISIMDRGFLFADGIYEVSAVIDGKLVDNPAHLARLERSLAAIRIENPYSAGEWTGFQKQLIAQNGLEEGVVYIQVTRGVAERDFPFPHGTAPTVVMFTQPKVVVNAPAGLNGVPIITVPDIRWARRDIKTIGLLAQTLAKQAAVEQQCAEAWMVEDGYITEGSSSTAFIITQNDVLVARPMSNSVLPGVTRLALLRLAQERGLAVEERLFSVEEAYAASEAFYTSASSFVAPVNSIDGRQIGSGAPGPHTKRLRELYLEFARGSLE